MEVLQVSKPLPWLMLIEARAGSVREAGTTGSDAPSSSTARQIHIRRRPGAQASAVPAIVESIWRPPLKAGPVHFVVDAFPTTGDLRQSWTRDDEKGALLTFLR